MTTPRSKKNPRSPAARSGKARPARRSSKQLIKRSAALDLEPMVFKRGAREIALSRARSTEGSGRRKSVPHRSAMSMLIFYENRAGRNLSARQKQKLARAKLKLRKPYDRD
jgi:hypothetical protein